MSSFMLTRELMKHPAFGRGAYGSGASTPLFMPVAAHESSDIVNDGAHTPVHSASIQDFEKRFKSEVVVLQSKLQELERTQGLGAGKASKEVLPPPGLMAPPPGLHLMRPAAAPTRAAPEKQWQVSVGTVGHPFSCAAACPFGGYNCPDGAKCNFCHECTMACSFQQPLEPLSIVSSFQQPLELADSAAAKPTGSIGSHGHPYTCGNACKYYKRKSGCRDGADCKDCHFCHWQRTPLLKPPAPQAAPMQEVVRQTAAPQAPEPMFDFCSPCKVEIMPRPPMMAAPGLELEGPLPAEQEEAPEHDECPSVGSIGHPFTCASACKYARKQRGCKDGKLCLCCHLCVWRRYQGPKEALPAAPRL